MADWVPVYRKAFSDPRMVALGKRLGVLTDYAVVHCARLWLELAEHSPRQGAIADVPDADLETWANWRGKRGRFAAAYRELFQVEGCVRNWDRYLGAALESSEQARERKRQWWREHRGKNGKLDADSPSSGKSRQPSSRQVQDKTRQDIPPKPPIAADGAAGPSGARAAAAGVRGGHPEPLSVTLAELAPAVGLTPPESLAEESPELPRASPPPAPAAPDPARIAELEAKRQRMSAELRDLARQRAAGPAPAAAHG